MTAPIYAIGDIHGHLDLLRSALAQVEADGGSDARIVFLGDYIDRGPDSRAVINLLINGLAEGRDWICLMGNHDRMFAMFMEDYPRHDACFPLGYHWLHDRIGGLEALRSYGIEVEEDETLHSIHKRAQTIVPTEHVEFLRNRPYFHIEEDLLFVHAGIRPGIPLSSQNPDDLIWIREEFLNDLREHPWLIVHGHTPSPKAEHCGNRVNLDSGAGEGRSLSVVVFQGLNCWELRQNGRVPLLPRANYSHSTALG